MNAAMKEHQIEIAVAKWLSFLLNGNVRNFSETANLLLMQ